MKWLIIFALLACALAQTTTPNLGMTLPAHGAQNWDTQMNGNFTILDNAFPLGPSSLVPSGPFAKKPLPSDSMQFVTAVGNDANDGLSWGTAKLTVMAAYDALPAKGGTIFITSDYAIPNPGNVTVCVNATSTPGQGIWVAGPADSQYNNLPPGWRQRKATGVAFIGVPTTSHQAQANTPQTCITGGVFNDNSKPGVKLSDVNNYRFENLQVNGGGRGLVVGEDSSGTRLGNSVCTGDWFQNVGFTAGRSSSSMGPAADFTGFSFQMYIKDSQFGANPLATTGANNQAAILLDQVGLIFIEDSHLDSGGIKLVPNTGSGSTLYVSDLITEAQPAGDAAVTFTSTADVSSIIDGITVADSGGAAAVRVLTGSGLSQGNVITRSVICDGPPCIVGEAMVTRGNEANGDVISAYRQGQAGTVKGRLYAQSDAARRGFGPVAARFTNLAPSAVTSWTVPGGSTLTPGITAPDGTTGAGRASGTGSNLEMTVVNSNRTISAGDYWIGGAWIRSQTLNGYAGGVNNNFHVDIGSGNTTTSFTHGAPILGDGEWQWVWIAEKVTVASTSPASVTLGVFYDTTHTVEVYAPILINVPSGTLSENEIYELAYNLQSYGSGCAAGTVCSLPSQTPQDVATAFSALPTCVSGLEGARRAVMDSTTATWGATITGGSTNHVLAYCDGTNWTVAAK